MADKKDIISYEEYQKLSEEEKQNYETKWNSDGKSGIATRKGAKLSKVKPTIPVTEMKVSEPDKTKTVLSREEAAKAGIKTGRLPTQFELEHPALSYSNRNVSDENGWIDNDGNIHLNSRTNEARNKAVESDTVAGRDFKTVKTPSAYELDLKNRTLSGKRHDGTYVHDEQDLKNIIAKYSESDPELAKAAQQEFDSRPKTSTAPQVKAAMDNKAQESKEETEKDETETEKDETKDPLEKAEELEQPQAPADIKKFSNDLNRFVIQAYLNGDFGKKSSPNAIATMGFFILDKIGTALVNASQVARGMSPSAKSQWSDILDKQTELLGNRITAEWFLSLSKEEQEALIRSGTISGTTARTIYETTDPNAVSRAEQRDVIEISKLSQEQKSVAQSNINALLARKSELQTIITQLKSDQGWEVYTQAMNAVVGTAKGLSSLGVTDNSSSSSQKGSSDTLSANVSTGSVTKAFVSGGISNSSSWNNSSTEALSKSNSLSQDALALSKFKSGESYAKATREAKKAANEQLIKRLEGQIEIIDKCIDSWGKDLGL